MSTRISLQWGVMLSIVAVRADQRGLDAMPAATEV
jgi:hypothetical protein